MVNEVPPPQFPRHESIEPETALQKVKADFHAWLRATKAKPQMMTFIRMSMLEPGFQLTLSIRLQEALNSIPILGGLLRRVVNYTTSMAFGSQIGTGSRIGGGLFVPHPWGIVIGHGVVIGKNAIIFQHVTLGRGDYRLDGYPHLSDDVTLYAGAKAFGAIAIGDHAVVGSNAVVVKDVPSSCVVAGVPAKIIRHISPRDA